MRLNAWVILAVVGMVAFSRCSSQGPTPGNAFPALSLSPLTGGTPWNPEMLKGKTTLVQVFAAWCPHCANEVEDLKDIKQRFPGVQIIGLYWHDEPQNLKPFLQRYGNPYDSIWMDEKDSINRMLKIPGVPALYVVDGNGVIQQRYSGELRPEVFEENLVAYIRTTQPKSENLR